jgi:hypothetical protein
MKIRSASIEFWRFAFEIEIKKNIMTAVLITKKIWRMPITSTEKGRIRSHVI